MRYWRFVSPGVGIVMRSALSLIADEAIESYSSARARQRGDTRANSAGFPHS
jgi:hypothetical protein